MKRLFGYIRVSTTRQAEKGVSLKEQRAAIQAYADKNGFTIVGWYEEHITEHEDGSFSIPDGIVQELADEASKLIAGNPELKPASWKIGYKPIPGDGEPVLGEVDGGVHVRAAVLRRAEGIRAVEITSVCLAVVQLLELEVASAGRPVEGLRVVRIRQID